jgi:RecB family exonuclease
MEDEGCPDDLALRADAQRAVEAAIPMLGPLTPVAAEQRFDVEIDGVALNGYIDLLARDADGRLLIVDYKTGYTPAEHYAMQFALYRHAVGRLYPEDAGTLLLRISMTGAALEPVAPASPADLSRAIATARTMESDEPRPGIQCRSCPYATIVCDAVF